MKHAISFNSATSAAHAAVSSAGIGPGDEVITSPFTMSATASSILMQGAVPVFADIEDTTYGLDPESVKKNITPRTKGILAVNIFGHPARLYELKKIADENGIELWKITHNLLQQNTKTIWLVKWAHWDLKLKLSQSYTNW